MSNEAFNGSIPKILWMYEVEGVQCPPNEVGCY